MCFAVCLVLHDGCIVEILWLFVQWQQRYESMKLKSQELEFKLAFTAQVRHNKRSCCVMWVFVVFRLEQRG